MKKKYLLLMALLPAVASAQTKWTETKNGDVVSVTNKGGQTLGYSGTSGVKILTVDGLAFKDLNKNGKLDKYEDWRLPVDVRAKDLASKMTVDQIGDVEGGLVPILLAAAVLATTVEFSFVAGVFDGIYNAHH